MLPLHIFHGNKYKMPYIIQRNEGFSSGFTSSRRPLLLGLKKDCPQDSLKMVKHYSLQCTSSHEGNPASTGQHGVQTTIYNIYTSYIHTHKLLIHIHAYLAIKK